MSETNPSPFQLPDIIKIVTDFCNSIFGTNPDTGKPSCGCGAH